MWEEVDKNVVFFLYFVFFGTLFRPYYFPTLIFQFGKEKLDEISVLLAFCGEVGSYF